MTNLIQVQRWILNGCNKNLNSVRGGLKMFWLYWMML